MLFGALPLKKRPRGRASSPSTYPPRIEFVPRLIQGTSAATKTLSRTAPPLERFPAPGPEIRMPSEDESGPDNESRNGRREPPFVAARRRDPERGLRRCDRHAC